MNVIQHLRCYIAPEEKPKQPKPKQQTYTPPRLSDEALAIKQIGAPYEGWVFVVDTETTTDAAQTLRFGTYAIYGLDRNERLRRYHRGTLTRKALDTRNSAGIFYKPETLTHEEIATLEAYAQAHDLACMSRGEFIRNVFYTWVYKYQALCIGHNLPFDLSRLATRWGEASGDYRGGFWLTLCDCGYDECFDHPPIRIKQLGYASAWIGFRTLKRPGATEQDRKRPAYRGKFLDTATLAKSVDGEAPLSLDGLSAYLGIAHPKLSGIEHGEALTADYLDYACTDVTATFEVYQRLRELYKRHGVSRAIWQIYSEASIAKAYLDELGVPRFMQQHKEFPKERLGQAMNAFYGGRSEVRIRLHPTEVIYCDFKSQYPTVNALMGLQDLLLAEEIEVRDCTEAVREWLAAIKLDDLQRPEAWKRLRAFVKVRPDNDLLPVRAEYREGEVSIGLNYLSGSPVWYSLADLVASVLLSGKAPEVLEAWELVPVGRVTTKPFALFGDGDHVMDLDKHDLFTKVVDLRDRIKQQMMTAADEGEQKRLDGLQWALKILANAGSYGVLVELHQNEPTEKQKTVQVYGADTATARTKMLEESGPYFAGPIGALIPAGGRLLLALAETLAAQRGIGHSFCDTDSMAFARPEGMERETFRRQIQQVIDWFTPLSPYEGTPALLRYEAENEWDGKPCPLFCIAVSDKRYALYNRLGDGSIRIRKFSSHGLGMYGNLTRYESHPGIPEPCEDVYKLGGHRWLYDLWHGFIAYADLGGQAYSVPPTDALNIVARFHVKACTANLLRDHGRIPGIRPFSFFDVLPALQQTDLHSREAQAYQDPQYTAWYPLTDNPRFRQLPDGRLVDADSPWAHYYTKPYDGLKGVSFYAPRRSDEIRRNDTHEVVQIEHKTVWECVQSYFTHKEWKMDDPAGIGFLPRRKITALAFQYIGKETNELEAGLYTASGGVLGEELMQTYGKEAAEMEVLRAALSGCSVEDLAKSSGIPARTLRNIRNGAHPKIETMGKLLKYLDVNQQSVCARCGTPIGGIHAKRYCSEACKKATYRSRQRIRQTEYLV